MGTLIYEVSPADGLSKGGPLLAGMILSGMLSFIYGPFVLLMIILFFPLAYTVYRYNRTTYQLSGEQLTVFRGQSRETIDLSEINSFRVDSPLWMSFFKAERAYFKNAAEKKVRLYLFGHQLMTMFRQLPSLKAYPTLL